VRTIARTPLLLRRRLEAAIRAFRDASFHRVSDERAVLASLRDLLPPSPVAVDVGASIGRWTRTFLDVHPGAHVVMVEAQPELVARLRSLVDGNANLALVNEVLAAETGRRDFYVCHGDRHRTGSSLLPELTGAPLEARPVTTSTLDTVLSALSVPAPVDVIKLDTQGSELDILRGARETLRSVSFVQLEVSLVRYNEASPLVDEVFAFMRERGFFVRDVFDLKYAPQHDDLIQLECLFARSVRTIGDIVAHPSERD
jgi:FkbM family methyltransferase